VARDANVGRVEEVAGGGVSESERLRGRGGQDGGGVA